MDYKSKGRSWIKLWVGEWLDGTTRYEMSGAQRGFWVDLLTMAGRSRVPGTVCAGNDENKLFGYPIARYRGILNDESVDVLETFKLFEKQGKIELIITRFDEPKLYAVRIRSWERYQSEYMRQRKVRTKLQSKTQQGAHKVTPENTERCGVEGEVEVEVDGEVEVEGEAPNIDPSEARSKPNNEKTKEKDKITRATKLLVSFQLNEEMENFAISKGVTDPRGEFEAFSDYHRAKGTVFKDWIAAWRTWCRNSQKFKRSGNDGRESFDQAKRRRQEEMHGDVDRRVKQVLQEVGSGVPDPRNKQVSNGSLFEAPKRLAPESSRAGVRRSDEDGSKLP